MVECLLQLSDNIFFLHSSRVHYCTTQAFFSRLAEGPLDRGFAILAMTCIFGSDGAAVVGAIERLQLLRIRTVNCDEFKMNVWEIMSSK